MTNLLTLALATLATLSAPSNADTLPQPGVLLTFDDTHVAEWVAAMPLFEEYGAKATFFVTRFDQLSPGQIDGLHKLEAAGHTIGCHGLRHVKAAEFTAKHPMDDYLAVEITPALDAMAQAGFTPTSFAYPSSNNNAATDAALLKTFRHLRTGTAPKNGERYAGMDRLFTPLDGVKERGCLIGRGIDRIGKPGNEDTLAQLFEAMERAAKNGELLTLYSHNIAKDSKSHHIMPATLEKVLKRGKELGLRFYGYDELP